MSLITAAVKGHPRDVICLVALWCGHKFLFVFSVRGSSLPYLEFEFAQMRA